MDFKKDMATMNIAEEEILYSDTLVKRIQEFKCFKGEDKRQRWTV